MKLVVEAPISFASVDYGNRQPFSVTARGITCSGEVIVAPAWHDRFGQLLSGDTTFRIVLLTVFAAPDRFLQDWLRLRGPRQFALKAATIALGEPKPVPEKYVISGMNDLIGVTEGVSRVARAFFQP